MDELKDRLTWARKMAGKSGNAVAKHAGISQPVYSELETGIQLSTGVLPQIADYLGVSALWLSTGQEPRWVQAARDANEVRILDIWRKLSQDAQDRLMALFEAANQNREPQDPP